MSRALLNRALALEQAAAAIESKATFDPTRSSPATEVRNYFDALELIEDNLEVAPDEDWMRRLHARPSAGALRISAWQHAGWPVHLRTARMGRRPQLMAELADWATRSIDELPDYLFAAILAYQFVTIHPFPDGNGRTCRALATWCLGR